MHKKFHISIKAVIVRDKRALILKRVKQNSPITYELPGGRIDSSEYIKDAFQRELFEEIGVSEFKLGDVVFAFERETYRTQGVSLMNIFYKVNIGELEIKLGLDHQEFQWVSKKDLAMLVKKGEPISHGIVKALNLVL